MHVTKKELCGLLQVSQSTLTGYIANGMGGKLGSGPATKYDVAQAIDFHCAQKVTQALKSAKSDSAATALDGIPHKDTSDAIIAHWKAKREEARTLREIGDLVTIETSNKEIQHRLTQVRNALDAVPAAWSPFVIGLTTLEEAQRVLSKELQTLYTTLSSLPDLEEDAEEMPHEDSTTETDEDA